VDGVDREDEENKNICIEQYKYMAGMGITPCWLYYYIYYFEGIIHA